jgi:hypothetical protein
LARRGVFDDAVKPLDLLSATFMGTDAYVLLGRWLSQAKKRLASEIARSSSRRSFQAAAAQASSPALKESERKPHDHTSMV